jgi:acyl-CoA thioesterase I
MKWRLFSFALLLSLLTYPAYAQKVACIGDSITYGSGISDRINDSYPGQLGQYLGQFDSRWEVRNFGVSARTLLRRGDYPYVNEPAFTQAKQWNPDIVVIMLGTNDTKPHNWAHAADYVDDYLYLIDAFMSLPSQPHVWICKPVPAFRLNFGIRDSVIFNEIPPMIDEIASQRDVGVIDLYAPLAHATALFPDGIHPNAAGSTLMMDVIAKVLLGIRAIPEFNQDGIIDLRDFAQLAQFYGSDDVVEDALDLSPVMDGDGLITLGDIAGMFKFWLNMPGLTAYWTFDEPNGIVAADVQGAFPGTVQGDAFWQPAGGVLQGALACDGLDDYVETDYVLNPENGPFTVLLWVKGGHPGEALVSQALGVTWLGTDPVSGALATYLDDGGRGTKPLVSDVVITDDSWHHVMLVWDGSQRHLIVDDIEVAVDFRALSDLERSRGGLYFGADSTLSDGSRWTGLIDDMRIYQEALLP